MVVEVDPGVVIPYYPNIVVVFWDIKLKSIEQSYINFEQLINLMLYMLRLYCMLIYSSGGGYSECPNSLHIDVSQHFRYQYHYNTINT